MIFDYFNRLTENIKENYSGGEVDSIPSRGNRTKFILSIAIATTVVFAPACGTKSGKKKSASVEKTCILKDGQQNTLQGKWSALPIKISFRNGDWGGEEVNQINKGGETWNTFYNESKGLTPFSLGAGNLSNSNQTVPSCTGSGPIADGVVLYKRYSSWTKASAAVAVTTTCYNTNQGGLAQIYNAIMEFNYVYFFTQASGQFPDLQSISVHELGHVLGLDHNCGPLGAPNKTLYSAGCPDPNANFDDPIIQAVMYPNVFFNSSGQGQVKQELTSDDQGRANCLY